MTSVFAFCSELPRPPTVTSVTLNQNKNNSVVLLWNKAFDGNSPLIKYIITYRQENPSESQYPFYSKD